MGRWSSAPRRSLQPSAAILALALRRAGLESRPLSADERTALLEESRLQKETVGPTTRRLVVDLATIGAPVVTLPIDEVYAACAPLVERSIATLEQVLADAGRTAGVQEPGLAGVYVVGGQSAFPPVYRMLRERFGQHRVHRSPHPFGACAIGLSILVAEAGKRTLSERLTRHFGVFREADAGQDVACDLLLPRDTVLPGPGDPALEVHRRYRAVHNVGHFRFFECARVDCGRPEGNVALWDELRFPFDAALRGRADLASVPVVRTPVGPELEEVVRAFPSGEVEVELRVLGDGYREVLRVAPRGG
jgi:hypothetical protein